MQTLESAEVSMLSDLDAVGVRCGQPSDQRCLRKSRPSRSQMDGWVDGWMDGCGGGEGGIRCPWSLQRRRCCQCSARWDLLSCQQHLRRARSSRLRIGGWMDGWMDGWTGVDVAKVAFKVVDAVGSWRSGVRGGQVSVLVKFGGEL
ncbi:hypothetical protein NDA11_001819 [Ustilago hordei]|uniref:Uncharacterized protein n=1 Tax=Ustilago hordei TaxID=120017 RepID=I2FRV6_USTHO|nr:hypothetical protein NDA15_004398 [Ustilago hordei]KAJ1573451.1 hypothetical protein NDA11_001819 [Ustilago hordei]KAJ1594536.1 hypothetical protein NDA12_007510 [Ustilago hordei]KAJ1598395.1 hypothetical protein NDA14_007341 [Ustilago hordei]CCF49649.1 uncharacterized protein UHOR_03159 [Ustilago hordei]